MNKLKALIVLTLLLASCGENKNANEEDKENEGIVVHFDDFPNKQFESIYLLQNTGEAKTELVKKGYVLLEGKTAHYKHPNDEIEILLSGAEELSQLRIFFLNETEIKEKNRLEKLLRQTANKSTISPKFSYFQYKNDRMVYGVSLFSQKDMLRLNIELIKKR